ncbi:hypothetical protein QEH59_04165 [Coraliomargarita sp. SDUM461004]|uniref:FG-GAP repeat protein n=1 Tax=Thalassobacterium sedimentorum TaxID=3041258 RepID=A0ABU1AFW3_9BACT|nr:hypothetical protein [Coraliomargarita sp. SDUM461004]MDQ8193604.1 hypothetical protein [Coraliomargarita sp. SDUM461004]
MFLPSCLFALVIALLLSLGTLSAAREVPAFGADIIERLIAPETRSQAFREVQIAREREPARHDWRALPMAAFELYHQNILVTECPQRAGEPLYMVSYRWDHASYSRYFSKHRSIRSSGFAPVENAHKPQALVKSEGRFSNWLPAVQNPDLSLPPEGKMQERVIVFLTDQGELIRPFDGDNMTEGDVFKDLNQDGRYERVYSSNFGLYDKRAGEPDIRVQALRVEAVDVESERLLYVLFNWHSSKSELVPTWGWAVRDLDHDGLDEIVLGPIADEDAEPEVKVVYRWNSEQGQYVGPQGSYDDHYLLLDPKVKLWDELHRVKAEGGLRYEALAAVNAPKIPEADVLAVPYDWREREPYRHRSLAGASDADLLQFMCGWSVVKPPPTGEVDLGVTASQSSIAVASDSSHRFEFKQEWGELDPRAAMFTFVENNQSSVHQDQYTLYYPTHLKQAESADWVVFGSRQGPGVEALSLGAEGDGRYFSAKYSRPLPEKYPAGEFKWKWGLARVDAAGLEWLQQGLWWLAQIRSDLKVRESGRYSGGSGFTTNCFPTYLETAPPSLRLLTASGATLIDIKAERASSYSGSWRDEFGPEQYLGFAHQLYQANEGVLLSERVSDVSLSQVLASLPDLISHLQAGRMSPQLAQAIVRSAGDSGDVGFLPLLQAMDALLPDPATFELEWHRLNAALEVLSDASDLASFRRKSELEAQMATVEQSMRDHLWGWLREPLSFAMQQLEVADDVAALSEWAQQAGEPGALWALARLRHVNDLAWRQALSQVFREQISWRENIIRYLAYQDRELANALLEGLPRLQQLKLMPSLVGNQSAANMDELTIQSLLDTIRAQSLNAQARLGALRKLIPKNEPLSIERVEIDQVLLELLQTEMNPSHDPWPERYLVHDAALFLLLRNQLPVPVERYIEAANARWNEFSFGSYLALMLHIAVVNESSAARRWLLDWGQQYIELDAGAWGRFAECIYAAELHSLGPFLQRLATMDAQAQEGGSALGKGRKPELMHGERYHMARRIIAVWSESDPLTRAKCELLLGFNFSYRYGPDSLYHPTQRVQERLLAQVQQLSVRERQAFLAFVEWCETAISPDTLGYSNRQYFEWVRRTFTTEAGA